MKLPPIEERLSNSPNIKQTGGIIIQQVEKIVEVERIVEKPVYIEMKRRRKPYTFKIKREYPSHWSQSMRNKYQSYYFRAKKHGRDMSLTFNEFEYLLSQSCVYCGGQSNITIDRIDSSLGYQVDNSQPCCYTCNTMKWNMDSEDFIKQCKRIASKY